MLRMREVRESLVRGFQALGGHFVAMSKDLASKRFWLRVVPALVPVILGAMAISSRVPRLILEGKAEEPRYRFLGEIGEDHPKFITALRGAIQNRLEEKLNLFSDVKAPSLSKTGDYLMDDDLLLVEIPTVLKVTNNGGLNTTIRTAEAYVVEEIDGKRFTRDASGLLDIEKNIPQGSTIELGGETRLKINLFETAALLVQYEVARLICKTVAQRFPKEQEWLSLSEMYLSLVSGGPKTRERMARLSNAKIRSRLMLIIEMRDVYDRVGRTEITLMDSVTWTIRTNAIIAYPNEQ